MVDRLLSTEEVAAYLGVPVATIYAWRVKGLGPRAARVGKFLRYRAADVERWLDANTDTLVSAR